MSMQPTPSTVKVIVTGFSCSVRELTLSPLCAATWLEIINDTGTAAELMMCNKEYSHHLDGCLLPPWLPAVICTVSSLQHSL